MSIPRFFIYWFHEVKLFQFTIFHDSYPYTWVSLVAQLVKNLPANAEDARDVGLIPGSGRSPGEGNGNPLQCSGLGNPMDTGARETTVHGVAKESDMTERLKKSLSSFNEVYLQIPLAPSVGWLEYLHQKEH